MKRLELISGIALVILAFATVAIAGFDDAADRWGAVGARTAAASLFILGILRLAPLFSRPLADAPWWLAFQRGVSVVVAMIAAFLALAFLFGFVQASWSAGWVGFAIPAALLIPATTIFVTTGGWASFRDKYIKSTKEN